MEIINAPKATTCKQEIEFTEESTIPVTCVTTRLKLISTHQLMKDVIVMAVNTMFVAGRAVYLNFKR